MFIQIEPTPNPATLKFLPGVVVLTGEPVDFRSAAQAREQSPLAANLFALMGVQGVFLGHDFITVTKTESASWDTLKTAVFGALMEHFSQNKPALFTANVSPDLDVDTNPISQQIRELMDTKVRPAVAQDGGDITFDRFEEGVVYLHLKGACAGCPSSTATLKAGIEKMLKHYIPEIVEVRQTAL